MGAEKPYNKLMNPGSLTHCKSWIILMTVFKFNETMYIIHLEGCIHSGHLIENSSCYDQGQQSLTKDQIHETEDEV